LFLSQLKKNLDSAIGKSISIEENLSKTFKKNTERF